MEDPVNPLLYVLGYGAGYVAQGTPADMEGLAQIIEEGIRYPGFAFVNVQSPCVTYGEDEAQLKAHKTMMQSLKSLGHDSSNRLHAMDLAQEYGTKLYTGVFYRNPNPGPTYEQEVQRRQEELSKTALPKENILQMFVPH
jgi:2-oxoglutarate ferredoxin oxidoreductase subunit beta